MTATGWPPALVEIFDMSSVALGELLDDAARMRAAPGASVHALGGEALAHCFENPDGRARVALEAAAHRLGMLPVTMTPLELAGAGQPAAEVARALAPYASAICVSAHDHRSVREIARASGLPVINGLTDDHDPCQALADLLTLRDAFGRLEGLVLAYVGGAGRWLHSLLEAAVLAGVEVRLACPPGRGPDADVMTAVRIFAERHGVPLHESDEPRDAVADADAVYTAPWPVDDHESPYRVLPRLMARAKPRAVFMHPLPELHGEEVSEAVINGTQSVVTRQAANRVPATQAAIHGLVVARRGAPDSAR